MKYLILLSIFLLFDIFVLEGTFKKKQCIWYVRVAHDIIIQLRSKLHKLYKKNSHK